MEAHWISSLALVFTCLGPLKARGQGSEVNLPIRMVAGLPTVGDVYLNGRGPYRFLLDTGNQSNELEAGLASELGLTLAPNVELMTPAGAANVQARRADRVALSNMEASDQEFMLTDMASLHQRSPELRGVLGQEFLRHFDYTLDLAHGRLRIGPEPNGDKINVRMIAGRMAVPTSEGDLILDSAAQLLFLFRSSAHAANQMLTGSDGVSTAMHVRAAPQLLIGRRRYYPDKAGMLAVPAAEEAGLLPAGLFKSIFISNSGMYVVLNPE